MNEATIIELVKNGEQSAYRELVDRYQAGVIIHCENITKDRDAAEDVAQDAFIKAYHKLADYDAAKATFSTWLYRIASNLALDYLRRKKHTTPLDEVHESVVEQPALSTTEKREVRSAVDALQPPEYARVTVAYYWEGMRYEAIAEELGVPVGTISTWLRRAKTALRKELS